MLQMHVTLFCASECSVWCVDYARRSCSCDLNMYMSFYARFSANGALPALEQLELTSNQIGDDGLSALASACASGALPKCTNIFTFDNPASDEAKQAVEDAIASSQ